MADTVLGSIGEAIKNALTSFINDAVEHTTEKLNEAFGLEFDSGAFEAAITPVLAYGDIANDVVPIYLGITLIVGGVIVQWGILFFRYVLGYFVGG